MFYMMFTLSIIELMMNIPGYVPRNSSKQTLESKSHMEFILCIFYGIQLREN
jgi:hypothetical protein